MSARGVIPGGSGFSVRWFRRFAVADMPVHASVTGAVEAAAREAATGAAGQAAGRAPSHAEARDEGGADPLTLSVSAREGYTLVSLHGEGDVTVRAGRARPCRRR